VPAAAPKPGSSSGAAARTAGAGASSAASSSDAQRRRAYRAGYSRGARGGERPAELTNLSPDLEDAYTAGQRDATQPRPAGPPEGGSSGVAGRAPAGDRRPSGRSSSSPAGASAPAHPLNAAARAASRSFPLPIPSDAGGFLLGLIGYALLWNFIQGGNAQARGWLAAKFLNKPWGIEEGAKQPAGGQPGAAPVNAGGALLPNPPLWPGGPSLAIPGLAPAKVPT
jgi:hypothetical protein